jgi:hypothetical protein
MIREPSVQILHEKLLDHEKYCVTGTPTQWRLRSVTEFGQISRDVCSRGVVLTAATRRPPRLFPGLAAAGRWLGEERGPAADR